MLFTHLDQIPSKELIPGFNGKVIHSETMTTVYWEIEEGAELPEHSHSNEQIAHVMEGSFQMTIGGKTKVLEAGELAQIPSNAVHSGKAITKCMIIDVFHPARTDLG